MWCTQPCSLQGKRMRKQVGHLTSLSTQPHDSPHPTARPHATPTQPTLAYTQPTRTYQSCILHAHAHIRATSCTHMHNFMHPSDLTGTMSCNPHAHTHQPTMACTPHTYTCTPHSHNEGTSASCLFTPMRTPQRRTAPHSMLIYQVDS